MPITFACEQCGKEIKAPDGAAGKRGKCPKCQHTNLVPEPADEIPLAPLDESEEERMRSEEARLRQQEDDLIHEIGGEIEAPLEQRADVSAEDLYHLVTNYCMDMAASKLERADAYAVKLKSFGYPARTAVQDFAAGKYTEPALGAVPPKLLSGFLTQLLAKLK